MAMVRRPFTFSKKYICFVSWPFVIKISCEASSGKAALDVWADDLEEAR